MNTKPKFFREVDGEIPGWRSSPTIKEECNKLYRTIKEAQDELAEIREKCRHHNTFIGNYETRPGQIFSAKICSDCGKPIEFLI